MPQEDDGTGELHHPEEILWVVFPANDHTAKIMKPCEQTLDLPAAPVATQHPAVLRGFPAAPDGVRRDHLHTETFANLSIQGVAVVGAVADQTLGSFGEEARLDGGIAERCSMRR